MKDQPTEGEYLEGLRPNDPRNKDQPTCPTCGGRGLIEQYPGQAVPIDCPACTGKQPTCQTCSGKGFVGHARQMGKRGPHLCPDCTGKQPEMIMGVDSAFSQEPSPSTPTSEREKLEKLLDGFAKQVANNATGTKPQLVGWGMEPTITALELLLKEARHDELQRLQLGLEGNGLLYYVQPYFKNRLKELENSNG